MEKNTGGILTSLNEIHMLKKWCYWHERIYKYQPNESLTFILKTIPFKEVRYVSDLKYCKEME